MKNKRIKTFFKKSLLVGMVVFLNNCSSGGGGVPEEPGLQMVEKNLLMYKGCADVACSYQTLYFLNPEDNSVKSVGNGIDFGTSSFASQFALTTFDPEVMFVLNEKLYLHIDDAAYGYELWVFDPLAPIAIDVNPKMIRDLNPGTGDAYPHNFTAVGDTLYFSAQDGLKGYELWAFDTAAASSATNPKMLKDLRVGALSSQPSDFFAVGSDLYFSANDGSTGRELWKYDTTAVVSANNPKQLNDNNNGASDFNARYFKLLEGRLFFCGRTNVEGQELWTFDPAVSVSATNPKMILDLQVGASHGCYGDLTPIGGKLYFSGQKPSTGREMFVYNPAQAVSATNPEVVLDITPGGSNSGAKSFNEHNGVIYFSASSPSEGNELWAYDTTQSTSASNPFVMDILSGSGGSSPVNISVIGDRVYFSSHGGVYGREPRVFDTTQPLSASNPGLIGDLNGVAAASFAASGSNPLGFIKLAGSQGVYFAAQSTGEIRRELFFYDENTALSASNPSLEVGFPGTGESIGVEGLFVFPYTVEE